MDLTELRTLYPELAAYLDWGDISEQGMDIDNQLIDYFRDYNICKLLNLRTTDYEQKFEELNANKDSFYKWYYSVPELKPISGYKMVQLDGVGAEWLPYILYCIRVLGSRYAKEVESFKLTRVMLPSITSTNRIEKAELVRDYDTNIIHKTQGYHYPRSLIEALGLIKELVRVHVMLSPDNKICICADHGASFMCRKNYGSENMHKHLEPSHEGRYYLGDQALPDNQAFFNVGDYFVAFKHHVISTNVRREVHGGATPEEVLVPYILVSKTALGYQREYDISLSGKSLSFDSRVLEVKITPSPDSIPEFWCGDIAITAKQEENVYLLDLSTYQPGKFEIKIKINTFQSFENIEIASGFIEEDLFDE